MEKEIKGILTRWDESGLESALAHFDGDAISSPLKRAAWQKLSVAFNTVEVLFGEDWEEFNNG